jgi:crossover junction endodeoxyribonuclease RusA
MIELTLPYPISANRYWRNVTIPGRTMLVPTREAKDYKEQVGWLCRAAGVKAPIAGRVAITIRLYPARPQDWAKRQRTHGQTWDDSVRCIDLDNANKVLLDSLKGVAIEDDRWVRSLHCDRMEPDEKGARVEMTIAALAVALQPDLLSEAA